MTETLQEYEQRPPARPTFLTVLCILTFIGSGWGIVSGIITYATAASKAKEMVVTQQKSAEDLKKNDQKGEGSGIAQKMVSSMSVFTEGNLKKAGIAGMVSALLCLAGAFMMWKLNKNGYYIYILGTLAGIASPFMIYGSDNIISIMSSIMVGFVGIVFVILYGVNLKYMK